MTGSPVQSGYDPGLATRDFQLEDLFDVGGHARAYVAAWQGNRSAKAALADLSRAVHALNAAPADALTATPASGDETTVFTATGLLNPDNLRRAKAAADNGNQSAVAALERLRSLRVVTRLGRTRR